MPTLAVAVPSIAGAPRGAEGRDVAAPAFDIRDFGLWYGERNALQGITMRILPGTVTAIVGPTGSGKSSLARALGRALPIFGRVRIAGRIRARDKDLYGYAARPPHGRIGIVYPTPALELQSILDRVLSLVAPVHGREVRDEIGERALREAGLWDEVKDRLRESPLSLSLGERQRLAIARAIAADPDTLILDDPCALLDQAETRRIEAVIDALRVRRTVVLATHDLRQAERVADHMALVVKGRLVEHDCTEAFLVNPREAATRDYLAGRPVGLCSSAKP